MVGGVVINWIDGIGIDKLLDGHDRRAFDLDALQILIREQQILVLPELVAFDEAAPLQLVTSLGILGDHADAVAGVGIDQVEPDRGAVMARVVERHRTRHEGQTEVTPPDGTHGHQAALSG